MSKQNSQYPVVMWRGSSYFLVNYRQVELHFRHFASAERQKYVAHYYRTDFIVNGEEAAIQAVSGIIEEYDAWYRTDKFMVQDGFVVPVRRQDYVMTQTGWDWADKPQYVIDCPGADPDMNFTKYLRLHGSELGRYPGLSEAFARYNAMRQRVQPQQQHEAEPAHAKAEPAQAEAEPAHAEAGVKVEPQDDAAKASV